MPIALGRPCPIILRKQTFAHCLVVVAACWSWPVRGLWNEIQSLVTSAAANSDRSIAIIGAGMFGVTAAIELRRRGWTVSLFEPGPIPRDTAASTDISKVVRMDYGADEFYTALGEVALVGWDLWNAQWGGRLYHEDGFLLLSRSPMQPGGQTTVDAGKTREVVEVPLTRPAGTLSPSDGEREGVRGRTSSPRSSFSQSSEEGGGSFEWESFNLLQARGHRLERMTSHQLKERHPAWISDNYPDGYFNPRGGWAESGKVVARLAAEVRALGVNVHEGAAFGRLLENGSRVVGIVTTDGAEHRADCVLVAAGAWTPTLLPHLADVMWATGQPVLHFSAPNLEDYTAPKFPVWAADIARTGWYGFPALPDGTLKIANHGPGRRVHPDEPRTVLPAEEQRFREFLRDSLPGLAEAPVIGSRLCLYCDTADGDFWIDHDPQRAGLIVAAGDSGHAFKFAPVMGGLIADVVERKPNPFTKRFAWRSAGPGARESARCRA